MKYNIGAARIKAFECLFQPSLAGKDEMGLADLAFLAVNGVTDALDKRLVLWDNVIITGGASLVKGKEKNEEEESGRAM